MVKRLLKGDKVLVKGKQGTLVKRSNYMWEVLINGIPYLAFKEDISFISRPIKSKPRPKKYNTHFQSNFYSIERERINGQKN